MRYNKIRKMDISNGPGVRIVLFVQGCTFNCKGCFNPETHDFDGGKPFTKDTVNLLIELCKADHIAGLSILGGEPLHHKNIAEVIYLCQKFKEALPHKTIWVWSGYTFEQIKHSLVNSCIDVLVDGLFDETRAHKGLKYRGSSNQRVVDVNRSFIEGRTIEIV